MTLCNKPRCFVVTCATAAVVLVILTAVSYPVLHKYVRSEVTKNVVLKEGSQLYDIWKGGKVPITFEVYIFNLTNEDEVINKGAKPDVTQVGPFVYKETRKKYNITFHDNGTVSYRESKSLVFDPHSSVGPESLNVTTISIPFAAMVSLVNKQDTITNPVLKTILDVILTGGSFFLKWIKEDLFITKSVGEIIWGYNDTLLQDLSELPIVKQYVTSAMVGVLYGHNNTDDGLYTVFTGEKNISQLGIIDKWNGNSSLSCWSTKYANMINGTDGTIAPPFIIDKDFRVGLYSTDICRSVFGSYVKTVNLHGVDLYRFSAPEREFLNATLNPDNAGFCTPAGNCWDSGVLNNEKCVVMNHLNIPVVTSNPHFHFAAKQYINAVNGINPHQDGLTTDIDIEPLTGLVMKAAKRLQININLNNTDLSKDFLGKTPTMMYPVLWINETAESDKDHAATVKSQLNTISYAHVAQIVLFAVAGLLLLAAIVVCAIYRKSTLKTGERQPLLSDGSNEDSSVN